MRGRQLRRSVTPAWSRSTGRAVARDRVGDAGGSGIDEGHRLTVARRPEPSKAGVLGSGGAARPRRPLPDLTRRRVGVDSTSIRHRRGEEREGGSVSHPAGHTLGASRPQAGRSASRWSRPPSHCPSWKLELGHARSRSRRPAAPEAASTVSPRRLPRPGLHLRPPPHLRPEHPSPGGAPDRARRPRPPAAVHRRPPGAGHRGAIRDRRGPRRAPGAAVPTGAVGQGSPAPGCRPLPTAPGHRRVAEPSVGETCGSRASRSCAATARSSSPTSTRCSTATAI